MSASVHHPKFISGIKYINIFDPVFFITLLEAKVFIPVISALKVSKDGILMYLLQVKDVNRNLTLDVLFSLPEEISASVKLGSPEEQGGDLQAVWETNDAASDTFKCDINRLLEYWMKQIQQANSFAGEPEIRFLPRSCKLKWPWKNSTNEEYFRKFDSEMQIHKLRLGVGYFSSERGEVGVSLQLSNYAGQSVKYLQENSKRRGKRARTEIVESVDPAEEGELVEKNMET